MMKNWFAEETLVTVLKQVSKLFEDHMYDDSQYFKCSAECTRVISDIVTANADTMHTHYVGGGAKRSIVHIQFSQLATGG